MYKVAYAVDINISDTNVIKYIPYILISHK